MIAVLDKFFFLADDNVLVNGAKNSAVVSFRNKEIYRANKSATRVIELGEKGYRISEAFKILDLEKTTDLLPFIEELSEQNLIQLSSFPKSDRTTEKPQQEPKLDFLWLEVISRCNLHCLHCYADAKQNNVDDPSTEDLRKWLNEASDLGCKKVQFTGGECTIRNDLRDLIDHAKKRGFEFIEVFTNGTLLTKSLVQYFSQNGINVAFSLYSYKPETHEAITGIPGSFGKTLNGLKLLLAYEVPVRCAVIAMKQNEDELEETSYFLKELGIFSRSPDPIRPTGRANMDNWPRKYGSHTMQTMPDFFVDKKVYEQSRIWNNCWFGKITITSEGNVLPCIFARKQVAGNMREQTLEEILQKGMLKFWSLNYDHVDICKDCEYRYFCHNCRPWAYGFTGNLYAKSPKCTYDPYSGEWGKAEDLSINNLL